MSVTPSSSCLCSRPAISSPMPLSLTAKKELVAVVANVDAARIDRFEACAKLIRECGVKDLPGLVGLCFSELNPDEDQFDLLCDTWHAYQATKGQV